MKLYTNSTSKEFQLYKKQLLELDKLTTSLVNFIDLVSPNYLILNYQYSSSNVCIYTLEQLQYLDILHYVNGELKYLNAWKLRKHQALINFYADDVPVLTYEGQSLTNALHWPRGFCLVAEGENHNHETQVSVYAWATSGTYYILSQYNEPTMVFDYKKNATDKYGTEYIFALCNGGSRIYYQGGASTFTGDFNSLDRITNELPETHAVAAITRDDGSIRPFLTTLNGTYWNQESCLLGMDLITLKGRSNNYQIEEIACDYSHSSGVQPGQNSVSYYNINTNINFESVLEVYANFY